MTNVRKAPEAHTWVAAVKLALQRNVYGADCLGPVTSTQVISRLESVHHSRADRRHPDRQAQSPGKCRTAAGQEPGPGGETPRPCAYARREVCSSPGRACVSGRREGGPHRGAPRRTLWAGFQLHICAGRDPPHPRRGAEEAGATAGQGAGEHPDPSGNVGKRAPGRPSGCGTGPWWCGFQAHLGYGDKLFKKEKMSERRVAL